MVSVPMKVANILMFTNLTFHGSKMNQTDCVCWTLDLRYSVAPGAKPMSSVERFATEFM